MPLIVYLQTCCLGCCSGLSFIDSTSLAVCRNRRIHGYKVFAGLAERGKTLTGWLFGFKLHLVVNDRGELLQFCITPCNVDDRKLVPRLAQHLFGKLFGDKGSVSQRLAQPLREMFNVQLMTKKLSQNPLKAYNNHASEGRNHDQKEEISSTIWEVPDDLWERIELLIDELYPPKGTGRPRADARRILDAILFCFRTGCEWNHIPRVYGDDATIHRTFQHWRQLGLFARIWTILVEECEELGQVQWEWQAADAALGKARMGGDRIGPNPTDRGKKWSKRSLLTEGKGGPLSAVVAAANVRDTKLLDQTLEAIVVERPQPTEEQPQQLCLDKGYDNPTGKAAVEKHGYIGHIRSIGEERLAKDKKVPTAPLGSRENFGVALQMSRYLGAL